MGCINEMNENDDNALQESMNGENCEPELEDMRNYTELINEGRDILLQGVKEEYEIEKSFEEAKEHYEQLRDEVKEILPFARIELEEKIGKSVTIEESERWDSLGLFSKSQIEKFVHNFPFYPSSGVKSVTFGGFSDRDADEIKKGHIIIYTPPLEIFAEIKAPLLVIEEKVAEMILIKIGHEIAHAYYRENLTEDQKAEWYAICFDRVRESEISLLAKKMDDEWWWIEETRIPPPEEEKFCEWAAYYAVNPKRCKDVDEEKYKFLESLLSQKKTN
jgi:hypothetical protein